LLSKAAAEQVSPISFMAIPLAACQLAAISGGEQVNRLIAACNGEVNARRRDRAIVLFFWA
jgi:hypothetical protein